MYLRYPLIDWVFTRDSEVLICDDYLEDLFFNRIAYMTEATCNRIYFTQFVFPVNWRHLQKDEEFLLSD
jgi:hypothetical protein